METIADLKQQSLVHWQENLRRLKVMDWKWWSRELQYLDRRHKLICVDDSYSPYIGGDECAFCRAFDSAPRCVRYEDLSKVQVCPLHEFSPEVGEPTGGCCTTWYAVLNALLEAKSKRKAIKAVENMIKRIEEID